MQNSEDRYSHILNQIPQADLEALATITKVPTHHDWRGMLIPYEFDEHIPFLVARMFTVSQVPSGAIRGQHGHYSCHQAFIAMRGSACITLTDGARSCTLVLDSPQEVLLIPPKIWAQQKDFSPDALMVVLASEPYDPKDYFYEIPTANQAQV